MLHQNFDISPYLSGKILVGFLFLAALDWLWRKKKKLKTSGQEARTTLLLMLGQRAFNAATALLLVHVFMFVYDHRMFDINLKDPFMILVLFLGEEFTYYWFHRSSHERRWLWATHSVHHSPTVMTMLSALRLGLTGAISGVWLFFLPMIWIGFPPYAVFGMVGLNLLYQFWLHTDNVGKLGWLEYVFNTPSHHRVHHSKLPEYINKNFGGVVIFYDRMFGSLAVERAGVIHSYGLSGEAGARTGAVSIAFGEWGSMFRAMGKARGPGSKLKVAFGKWE